jgi:hypothetical protein
LREWNEVRQGLLTVQIKLPEIFNLYNLLKELMGIHKCEHDEQILQHIHFLQMALKSFKQ